MIPYGRHHIDEDDIAAVADLMRSGAALTQGPTVERFENAVAAYVGVKYAIAVANATCGLHIAALAAGVGPGTSLVTSPITFVASANAALYAGARPLFADIDADTVNMSPAALDRVLKDNADVRAVIPVHFAGLACDMPAIRTLTNARGVKVVEDAAHALGGSYPDGGRIGNCAHSDMTVFSFHPVKAIAAGEGGMVTTNDESLYRRLLRLRSHGINKLDDAFELPEQAGDPKSPNLWYHEMQELGFNYRITDIQSALALSQLGKLDQFVARRRQLASTYNEAFADFRNLRIAQPEGNERSGRHLFVVRINYDRIGRDRNSLMRELRARGIGSQVHYIPVPAQPVYRRRQFRPEDYPAALDYYRAALTIPLYFDLTDQQQAHIITALRELVG